MNGRSGGTRSAGRRSDGGQSLENVVLLSIDSLRADHCGFLGCERDTTPTLDGLATDGLVFENAIAAGPRTPSSMPVAFTGRFNEPSEFAYGDWGHRYERISAHLRRHRTIQERLQDAGYATVGVTLNPWTQRTAFDTGFDRFVEVTGDAVTSDGSARFLSALDWVMTRTGIGETYDWHLTKDWFVQWPHYYDAVLEAVDGVREPYFLWVFSLDPHQPYLAPRRYRRESSLFGMYYANFRESAGDSSQAEVPRGVQTRLTRAYRDAVRSADGFVETLLGDLAGDPTVVVHADHGEAFGEHGSWGHPAALYEENVHVPVVVANGAARGRVASPFSLRALPDLVSAVTTGDEYDPEAFTREYVMAATEGLESVALRGSRWKYIRGRDGEEVYDLAEDPGETTDLADTRPDVAGGLRLLLDRKRRTAREETAVGKAAQQLHEEGRFGGARGQA